MTDEQVVEVLARRLEWEVVALHDGKWGLWNGDGTCWPFRKRESAERAMKERCGSLLTSHDALRPVLLGLSEGEWERLHMILALQLSKAGPAMIDVVRHILTLPPHTLSHAIAEVLDNPRPAGHDETR